MKSTLLALAGATLCVLAFPPVGVGFLVVPGIALFLIALLGVDSRREGFVIGFAYGLAFWGGLMWFLLELHWTALTLAPVQAVFTGLFGWWVAGLGHLPGLRWAALATGSWALMELLRYRVPVGGQEWGAAGYALSGYGPVRSLAPLIGTTGITVLVVGLAAMGAAAALGRRPDRSGLFSIGVPLAMLLVAAPLFDAARPDGTAVDVAIVQGSTPCPFEFCPPNQRLRTFELHLELTATIEEGVAELVVWPESSTGSTNADPVNNEWIGRQIGEQAERIGSWLLVGSDRVVSETSWINANVVFDPSGAIVGEYRKQQPVPFGEYIPWRSFFTWLIPELYRVPRDMIRGEGPVVFVTPDFTIGSVISWEGGFSRYSRRHVAAGADLMVVATNNDSYGPEAPTSFQFIGMTRMRAAELGVPVVHAAVTGRSVVIDRTGAFVTDVSGLGTAEVLYATVETGAPSVYARTGDLLMYGFVALALLLWARSALVPSRAAADEEE